MTTLTGKVESLSFSKGNKLMSNYVDLTPDSITVSINIRENKINDAVLLSNDDAGKTYLTNVQIGDIITVNFAYVDDDTENWKEVFSGMVVGKEPVMDAEGGSICRVQLYAYPAIALNRMRARGSYSLDPNNLDTIREILCGKIIGADNDFPNYEFFTETGTVNNSSTWVNPTADSDWQKNATIGYNPVMAKVAGGATNDSDYCVSFSGLSTVDVDFTIGPFTALHGFPLFIDQFSNPQYDASTGTWYNIPYLTFYIKRDDNHSWFSIQLRRSGNDYLEFETDKNYIEDGEVFNLIPDDEEWHKIEIPVGRFWNKASIKIDGYTTIQSWMNTTYEGDPLNKWFGWNSRHSGESGGGSSADENGTKGGAWNDITDINFHLHGMSAVPSYDAQYYIDLITISTLNNQYGIIPAYVNKDFNNEDSGYDINTDCIYNNGQEVPFSKFVYQPVTKCLQDIGNLVAGKNWLHNQTCGIHWIMIGNKLCIAPVNNHNIIGAKLYLTSDALLHDEHIHIEAADTTCLSVGMNITVGSDTWSETATITAVNTTTGLVNLAGQLASSYTVVSHGYIAFVIDEVWSLASKYTEQQPLVVSEDIIRNNFRHYEPESNYVIVNGLYESPPESAWTNASESRHTAVNGAVNEFGGGHLIDIIEVGAGSFQAQWRVGFAHYSGDTDKHSDRAEIVKNCVFGPNAIRFNVPTNLIGVGQPLSAMLVFADPTHIFDGTGYPVTFNNPIDLNILQRPELTFWSLSRDIGPTVTDFKIRIFTDTFFNSITTSTYFGDNGDGSFFEQSVNLGPALDGVWTKHTLQIGEGAAGWTPHGDASWSRPVIAIMFRAIQNNSLGEWFILDGLNISSQSIRVAKSSNSITKQGGIKTKLINELLIQGYSTSVLEFDALDELTAAECLRCVGMLQTVSETQNNTAVTECDFETIVSNGTITYAGNMTYVNTSTNSPPHGTYCHIVSAVNNTTVSWTATPTAAPITISANDVWMKLNLKIHVVDPNQYDVDNPWKDAFRILFMFNNCYAEISVSSADGINGKVRTMIGDSVSNTYYDIAGDVWYELKLHLYKNGPYYIVELYDNDILRCTAVAQNLIGDITEFEYYAFINWGFNQYYYDYFRVFGKTVLVTERVPITTGSVVIPFDPELLGGQQVWIKSPLFSNIPKCFRLLYVNLTHTATDGALSRLFLTDDLSNSYAIDPTDLASTAIRTVNPDFQNRNYTRLMLGSIVWNTIITKIIDVDTL